VATAAAATRNQDVLDLAVTPLSAQGAIEVSITPVDWSGVEPGADVTVVTRAGGADDLLHAESAATGGWATSDGSTQIVEGTTPPADGVAQAVRVEWRTGSTESVSVDGATSQAVYDGARAGAGVYRVAPTVASVTIANLKIYEDV
jgi:hypothetical protein